MEDLEWINDYLKRIKKEIREEPYEEDLKGGDEGRSKHVSFDP